MRAVHVAIVALVTATLAAPSASEAKRTKPPRNSTTLTAADIRNIHDTTCPTVVEYANCASITVIVDDYGPSGYQATSGPGYGVVEYNTYYPQDAAGWRRTVSHEMGGHHDAWAELVARGTKPWTDYYDLDTYAEPWAEARYLAVMGVTRDFSKEYAKEMYLDCVGPVAHGYLGRYLGSIPDQPTFCLGNEDVMNQALE